jgi:flagellar basal body rod protein FlgG
VREGANAQTESQRGRLRVVSFAQAGLLQKDGNGTFVAPANVTLEADRNSLIVQGSIEKSNVRGVVEMTRMIEITRTYAQVAALLQQQQDLQQTSIDKLAEVPA